MKSPSLDKLYLTLNKHILLIEGYTEIPNLAYIFKACRLKPVPYFFEKRNNNIVLYTTWFDEYGNLVKITNNKDLKIIYGDLSLDKNKIICTDLYYGLSLDKICKISKLAYISCGIDEDMYQDCALISFLGIDNYFRTYLYLYGYWQQVSTLILGIKNLKLIGDNLNLKHCKELSNIKNIKLPCTQAKTWLTSCPMDIDFLNTLDKQYQ
jgi:hypothetical protein